MCDEQNTVCMCMCVCELNILCWQSECVKQTQDMIQEVLTQACSKTKISKMYFGRCASISCSKSKARRAVHQYKAAGSHSSKSTRAGVGDDFFNVRMRWHRRLAARAKSVANAQPSVLRGCDDDVQRAKECHHEERLRGWRDLRL